MKKEKKQQFVKLDRSFSPLDLLLNEKNNKIHRQLANKTMRKNSDKPLIINDAAESSKKRRKLMSMQFTVEFKGTKFKDFNVRRSVSPEPTPTKQLGTPMSNRERFESLEGGQADTLIQTVTDCKKSIDLLKNKIGKSMNREYLSHFVVVLDTISAYFDQWDLESLQAQCRELRQDSVDLSNRFYLLSARLKVIEQSLMGRVTSLINEHQKCVDKKPLGIHYPKQKTLSNSFR